MRRAQLVLDRLKLHQALGLQRDLRVVAVYAEAGGDGLRVVVEGDSLPVMNSGGQDDWCAAAWNGAFMTPHLSWPLPVSPPPAPAAGPEGAAERMVQRVDEGIAADPEERRFSEPYAAVNVCKVDESVGVEPEVPTASPLDRLREAAADAARAGEPPFALIGAVQGAIRRTHDEDRESVRIELLETTERVVGLLERFLRHEGRQGRD